eukprot:IDg13755t1
MRVAVFSAQRFESEFLNSSGLDKEFSDVKLEFFAPRLDVSTARLAGGFDAVCAFVNDVVDASAIKLLSASGVRCILLRCAGFNNVDLGAAREHGVAVLRVPQYSPNAVAEFAVALLLALARKTHRAYARVRDGNFAARGLLGFEVHGRTVGVVGTGKIGRIFARIMVAFGATVLAHDVYPCKEAEAMGVRYVPLAELLAASDVVSLHCPLLPSTRHIIDGAALAGMRDGATLINVSRGELLDTGAVIAALKSGKLAALGIDVHEGEADLFFKDRSGEVLQDDHMLTLQSLPNVLVTPHVAFLTDVALSNIWTSTFANAREFLRERENGGALEGLPNPGVRRLSARAGGRRAPEAAALPAPARIRAADTPTIKYNLGNCTRCATPVRAACQTCVAAARANGALAQ